MDPRKNPYFQKPKAEEPQHEEHQIQAPAHQYQQQQQQHQQYQPQHGVRVPTYIHVV